MKCARPACGLEFTPDSWRNKYCSWYCARKEKSRRYRAGNPTSVRRSYDLWRSTHLDEARENRRRWYWHNREHSIAYAKNYVKAHWDITKQRLKARRSIRRSIYKSDARAMTALEWKSLLEAYEYKCAYCGLHLDLPTQDHVIPLAKGGSCSIDNVVPACLTCNCRKGDMDVFDFVGVLMDERISACPDHRP